MSHSLAYNHGQSSSGVCCHEITGETHATVEVHHFFFLVSSHEELRTSPKI